MGIEALEAPTRNVGSKYDFDQAELAAAEKLLGEGKWPGNKGYTKEGQARSAAARLLQQLAESENESLAKEAAEEFGNRVWNLGDEKKPNWAFVLKMGKRKANGSEEDGPAPE